MQPRKDREQPIIELKTVTIPRAQFPTRQQINSPIEIKISPSTLRIEPVRSASLLSLRSEKRSRRSKSRMLAAHGTGSLSIHLVHVCTQVLTYVAHARMRTRVASSWSWARVVLVFVDRLNILHRLSNGSVVCRGPTSGCIGALGALSKNVPPYYSAAEYLHSTRRLDRQKGEIRRTSRRVGGVAPVNERKTSGNEKRKERRSSARRHGTSATMQPRVDGRYVDIRLIPIECLYCI